MAESLPKITVKALDTWANGDVITVPGYGMVRHPIFGLEKRLPVWVANYLLALKKIHPFEAGSSPVPEAAPLVDPPVVLEAIAEAPEVVETPEAIADPPQLVEVVEEVVPQEELEAWQTAFLKFLNENEVAEIKTQLKGKRIGERVIDSLKKNPVIQWSDVTLALNEMQIGFAKTFAEGLE